MDNFSDKISKIRKKLPSTYPEMTGYGKIPPQAIDIECKVLGAIMMEKTALPRIATMLKPDIFYKEEHKEILTVILDLFSKNKPIDIITVSNELKKTDKLDFIGGAYYISELTNGVGSSANIEYHCQILIEKYILREAIRTGNELIESGFDDLSDAFETLDKLEKSVIELSDYVNSVNPNDEIKSQIIRTIEQIEKSGRNEITGQRSAFIDLGKVIFEYEPQTLIYIGARPGIGKTAFVLREIHNSMDGLFFSLEMSAESLIKRLISQDTNIEFNKIRSGKLEPYEWDKVNNSISIIENSNIKIIDKVFNFRSIKSRAKNEFLKHHYSIIVIDYLQLIPGEEKSKDNRNTELEKISRGLKQLAKELNVPIIVLSQLNRDVEQTKHKKPEIHHLRDSGSIEQDADIILLLWRPEYYDLTNSDLPDKLDLKYIDLNGYAECEVAKNKNGETKRVQLRFIKNIMKFTNYTEKTEFKDITESNEPDY